MHLRETSKPVKRPHEPRGTADAKVVDAGLQPVARLQYVGEQQVPSRQVDAGLGTEPSARIGGDVDADVVVTQKCGQRLAADPVDEVEQVVRVLGGSEDRLAVLGCAADRHCRGRPVQRAHIAKQDVGNWRRNRTPQASGAQQRAGQGRPEGERPIKRRDGVGQPGVAESADDDTEGSAGKPAQERRRHYGGVEYDGDAGSETFGGVQCPFRIRALDEGQPNRALSARVFRRTGALQPLRSAQECHAQRTRGCGSGRWDRRRRRWLTHRPGYHSDRPDPPIMAHWQERITAETPPAIVTEHELRYRLVQPLVATSAVWTDLGCGTGVAAASALRGEAPAGVVLVDLDRDAVAAAAAELELGKATQLHGDLTEAAFLERIERELMTLDGPRIVSCFEVIEHLVTFVPLLEWAGRLAGAGEATFLISVPNDAFWSIENPYHAARWGEGAFNELRALLPAEHTLLRQVTLAGSALVGWDDARERHELSVDVGGGDGTVASHFIAAFGPRHAEVTRSALASPVAQLEQRRWERQRESNLAFAEARLEELSMLLAERDQWRAYIHELERELGRPLSGAEPAPPTP